MAKLSRRIQIAFFLTQLFCCLFAPSVRADQTIIVDVSLNGVSKGDYFVILKDDGDFLVKADDLKEMGFGVISQPLIDVEGEGYVSLRGTKEVHFSFDEKTLSLKIDSAPALLQRTTVDLKPEPRANIYRPRDNSFFLNYGMNYTAGGNSLSFQSFDLTNEAGLRWHDLLFFTSTDYTETSDAAHFARLMSNVTYDSRASMQRLVVGDQFAGSGELGSNVNMGGISFSKLYTIDPYFIQYPLFNFSGMLPLSSDVDLYLDGVRVETKHFQPGQFDLTNFEAFGGAHNLEIVLRDAMGRERRIMAPFYFTDTLLRKGLTEYSYNLGFLRQDYGDKSAGYGTAVALVRHRFGISDTTTLGFRGEGGDGLFNLGGNVLRKLGANGLLGLQVAGSLTSDSVGWASKIRYEYQSRRFSARFSLEKYSPDFANLDRKISGRMVDYLAQLGVGYSLPAFGSLSLTFAELKLDHEGTQPTLTASFSRRLTRDLYLNVSYRHTEAETVDDEALCNFSYYFDDDATLSGSLQVNRDGNTETLEARKDLPIGEGYAWRTTVERSRLGTGENYSVNPALQYNGPYGIYRGEFLLNSAVTGQKETLNASLSGALVHVGDALAVTRPVTDSFGLVKVGDVEGVEVSANSQKMGRTNAHGEIIVPSLNSFYDNEVAIEDKDIPMDYLMPQIHKYISPPYRSGSCLVFPLERYQAFTGKLLTTSGAAMPVADAEVTLAEGESTIRFYTGKQGEFYFDNDPSSNPDLFKKAVELNCATMGGASSAFLGPGPHQAHVRYQGQNFPLLLKIPEGGGAMTDLGAIATAIPPASPNQSSTEENAPKAPVAPAVQPKPAATAPAPTPLRPPASLQPQSEEVHFAYDKSDLTPAACSILERVAGSLRREPDGRAEITGYADSRGSDAYNLRLGLQRAEAVKTYLLARGVAVRQIIRVISYGERKPRCQEKLENCYRMNRRVTINLVTSK